ncbi:S8/S53 family peptidase [Planotetraspora kaengkrachanensis]|uniref:Protease n=1 Tax=Planotetraspora kaengkrachanensis TaxID=575193 RepID=A0A8J3PS05_9ACTN|nr:S8/S53 family peptidase [Planotetraspora kaengkrachanensis]GIG80386.1 protease [Planotetraspora kaengkrachanensis]
MAADRFKEQFDQIQASMPEGVQLAVGDGESIYEKGHVIARSYDLDEVIGRLRSVSQGREDQIRPADGDVRRRSDVYRIQVGDDSMEDVSSDWGVAPALEALGRARNRTGQPLATRNHVVHIANVNCCPNDEPDPQALPVGVTPQNFVALTLPERVADAERALNPPRNPMAPPPGQDGPVRVLVVDTGLVDGYASYPWLADVTHPEGQTNRLEGDDGVLDLYAGHGTFIASIIKAVAPHAAVRVDNGLVGKGALLEHHLGERLLEVLGDDWPDIISLSAGTLTPSDDPTAAVDELKGLEGFMEQLMARRTLLVAAAGNNGNDKPFVPAAYAALPKYANAVVSVGALRSDGTDGACFTSHGPWVRVYAPGERLLHAFTAIDSTPPEYVYQHSTYANCRHLDPYRQYECTCRFPRHTGLLSLDQGQPSSDADHTSFTGLARWSGTSFSTPIVVASIVNYMQENGLRDPREAADALIARNQGAGTVFDQKVAVILPPGWQETSTSAFSRAT